jgi:hypothetical protein
MTEIYGVYSLLETFINGPSTVQFFQKVFAQRILLDMKYINGTPNQY